MRHGHWSERYVVSNTRVWPPSLILLWQVFEYKFIKAFHLRSLNPSELTLRLAPSLARYNGKDALVVVIKDGIKGSAFSHLEHQPGVRTIPLEQLCPPVTVSAPGNTSGAQETLLQTTDDAKEQYSMGETNGIITIQRLWRSVSRKINKRRAYVSILECRATARFFNLSARVPSTINIRDQKAFRRLLVLQGAAMYLRLETAKESLSTLQQDVMTCIEKVEIDTGLLESVDDMLHRNSQVEALLKQAEEELSDECLQRLVREGVLSMLEKTMKDVKELMAKAEESMSETREMVDMMAGTCT